MIITAGLYGSGSTWAYNVIRLLLQNAPSLTPVHAGFADALAELPEPEGHPGSIVIKTHCPDRAMRIFARATAAPVVMTVRDPRDAITSMMQRFGVSCAEMRDGLIASAHLLLGLAAYRPALVLRYEDGFSRSEDTVKGIAAFLGLRASAEQIARIAAALTPERVVADIAALVASGGFGATPNALAADPVTQWHPGHVGDGRVGKWREVLTEAEAAALMADCAAYCRAFRYGPDAPGG